MPSHTTEITEVATALGMLGPDLAALLQTRPPEVLNVGMQQWDRLEQLFAAGTQQRAFETAFENGRAFLSARDGLRGRRPLRIEWKGPHRAPGDDVIPADLRVDHVYLVSCKYLSRVLANCGPPRLFDRLLAGDDRSPVDWFGETAPQEFQQLYADVVRCAALPGLPALVGELSSAEQHQLRDALRSRSWPDPIRSAWDDLSSAVATVSAQRWRAAMTKPRDRLRLLWRLLRITTATYFVLGSDRTNSLRFRIDSAWDWTQSFDLQTLDVTSRAAGQPVVDWHAVVRHRDDGTTRSVHGHVEVRWSHGRFNGRPEAKVYLDTPHHLVPGYNLLT